MRWLLCLFSHKYYVVQEFERGYRKVACERCGKVWGMSDEHQAMLKWDDDFDRLYHGGLYNYPNIKPWK